MTVEPVFRNYDQQALDAQYNNRARFPNFTEQFDQWTRWSVATRRTLPCRLDIVYGDDALERLDVFPAEGARNPIYVFLHGGYWYSLDKSHYSYVAEGMRPHGIVTAVTNFGLAPRCDMDTIVEHNRRSLAWLWRHATSFGGDPDRIYVCGHSAGGHLGLMLLGTDWADIGADLPHDLVKGVCAIGGIFDMEPIRLSFLNEKLHLTAEQARRNSPLLQRYPVCAPLSLVVAVDESAEFHRQSEQMRDLWSSLGYPVELMIPSDFDHFTVVNELGDPRCALVLHQLAQMRLAFS
ncbi:MAG: alpha/beta hydrolase [Proteobacteria bacterium]|nr:alpha/beta hydrolase [Burkholderiales bacterium]